MIFMLIHKNKKKKRVTREASIFFKTFQAKRGLFSAVGNLIDILRPAKLQQRVIKPDD